MAVHNATPIPSEKLCLQCRSMFASVGNLERLLAHGFEHYSNVGSLVQQNGQAECPFCHDVLSLFRRTHHFRPFEVLGDSPEGEDTGTKKNWKDCEALTLEYPHYPVQVLQMATMKASYYDAIDIFAYSASNFSKCPASKFLTVPSLHYHKVGDKITKRILHRLEECQDSHANCQRRILPLLPTRVIDVGLNHGNPRLHLSATGQCGRYTALSYCWGNIQQPTTSLANIHSMTLNMPLHALPKTIQDAITVTRNLRIQYLWVDALCIIQDDPVDRKREIRGMGTIYKHAILTIAAMSAESAHHGFIEDSTSARGYLFPLLLPDGSFDEIELIPRHLKSTFRSRSAKLGTRGWALQEFLLSPRLLLFYDTEVEWHCQTHNYASLVKKWNKERRELNMSFFRMPYSIFLEDPTEIDQRRKYSSGDLWSAIVRDFSGRAVRLQDDKFHAMAGIISELRKVWRDPYTAGFWHSTMIWNLSWQRDSRPASEVQRSYRSLYKAPSWSWLSVNEPIKLPVYLTKPQAQLVDCWALPVDYDLPDGPLCDGVMNIKTWGLPVSEIASEIDVVILEEQGISRDFELQEREGYTSRLKVFLDWDVEVQVKSRIIVLLGIVDYGDGALPLYVGLILEEIFDKRFKPCYRRIGRWEHDTGNKVLIHGWNKVQEEIFHIV